MKILGFLLAAAFLYAVWVGLGLGKTFKRSKFLVKTQVINDFEFERDDFDLGTGGYVTIEPSKENKIHGRLCAKVIFKPTEKFYATPVPGVPPSNSSQVFYSQEGKASWGPQIILDTRTVTKLDVYEWQDFEKLRLDAYNEQDYPVTFHLQIADSKSFVFQTSGEMGPKKVTNIEVSLLDLKDKDLDLTSIHSLRFWVGMNDAVTPAVVYLDYIRLEGDITTAKRKPTAVPATSPAGAKPTPTVAR